MATCILCLVSPHLLHTTTACVPTVSAVESLEFETKLTLFCQAISIAGMLAKILSWEFSV